jgi:preprotein translocase subunit SecD
MSKRFRLFIILLVLAVSFAFLYPTFNWYFLIPKDKKELAMGSRQDIRAYARRQATEDLALLKELAAKDPEAAMPEGFDFLIEKAADNYRLEKKERPKEWTVRAVLASFKKEAEAYHFIESYYGNELLSLKEKSNGILQLGLDLSGGMSILLRADQESLAARLGHNPSEAEKKDAIDRAMEILNNRIDQFGVSEPQIRKQGQNNDQIAIEIPGAADPERVNRFLMGKGSLNFHIVDDAATSRLEAALAENPGGFLGNDDQPVDPTFLDAGYVVRGFYVKDNYGIDQLQRYLVIAQEVGLDGNYIQSATVGSHPITGKPVINFQLTKEGGEIFFQLTSANVGKTLAIVLDDKIKAGARISEAIRDSVQMTGFDRQEATDLALVLRTAAMPVDLIVESQQSVGASLGEDSIRIGLKAVAIGFALVVVFMILYYLTAGVYASIALILNVFFMVAILSAFNFTVTLTSLAGLILTVGMAVDANVIIYERIKEEYRLGKSAEASIKAGFKKAFWTIMDSNITTLIAAVFLSQLGSGPIQGFAYTLAVGIVSSLFTALVVCRLLFDFTLETLKVRKLSISWRIR